MGLGFGGWGFVCGVFGGGLRLGVGVWGLGFGLVHVQQH